MTGVLLLEMRLLNIIEKNMGEAMTLENGEDLFKGIGG